MPSQLSKSDLEEIEARVDAADVPRLVSALRLAYSELESPTRIEHAWSLMILYLQNIETPEILARSMDQVTIDRLAKIALNRNYINEAVGSYKLTKRGLGLLKDHLRSPNLDI